MLAWLEILQTLEVVLTFRRSSQIKYVRDRIDISVSIAEDILLLIKHLSISHLILLTASETAG